MTASLDCHTGSHLAPDGVHGQQHQLPDPIVGHGPRLQGLVVEGVVEFALRPQSVGVGEDRVTSITPIRGMGQILGLMDEAKYIGLYMITTLHKILAHIF